MATVKFTYAQDADTVYKFASDAEICRKRSEAFGDKDIRCTKTGDTVTNVRLVEADVPSFAKKFINATNTVTDVKAWNPTTKSATLSVEIKGVPVKITGDIRIVPAGSGSDYIVNFQVACKIPLIGGQLEKHITGVTEDGMRKEFEWNKANIG